MAVVATWTYSGDPRSSPRDAVRFLIRDTNEADQHLSDEEIAFLLGASGNNPWRAAVLGADRLAADYAARSASGVSQKTVGPLSISYSFSEAAQSFREIGADLRRQAALGFGSAFAAYSGGISKADKDSAEADTDWDQPYFTSGMHESPAVTDHRVST